MTTMFFSKDAEEQASPPWGQAPGDTASHPLELFLHWKRWVNRGAKAGKRKSETIPCASKKNNVPASEGKEGGAVLEHRQQWQLWSRILIRL